MRNARAFPLLPAALASVPFGFVLVRVRVRMLLLLLQLPRLRLDELPLMATWKMLPFGDINALRIIRKRNLERRLTKTLAAARFFLWSVGGGQCLQTC